MREATERERNEQKLDDDMCEVLTIHAALAAFPALVAAGNSPETAAKLALDYGWAFEIEVAERGLTCRFPTTGVVALDYTSGFGRPKV